MNMMPNLFPALPELTILISSLLILLLGVFYEKNNLKNSLFLSLLVLFILLFLIFFTNQKPDETFNGLFIVNSFTAFTKVMIVLASIFSIFLIKPWLKNETINIYEVPVLILFSTLGMMMMLSANDLISLYVGLELQSLSLYVLASFNKNDLRSAESGVKYFVLGALASGLLLYGSSLIYGYSGSTNFNDISLVINDKGVNLGIILGLIFLLSGFAFKISAVPFHMWTPDVYEGAPTPITAYFSVAPKIAALCLLLRILYGPLEGMLNEWRQILIFFSVCSMLWGSIAAIAQTNIKRIIAYSSIGHVGYALIGIISGTPEGVRGVLYYLLIYMFMNIGTFCLILSMKINDRYVEDIKHLSGISKTNPVLAFSFAVIMFSMAGIPPLAGFFAKYFIFISAIEADLVYLAIIGVLSSVIGAFYYIRLIKIMYFDEVQDALDSPSSSLIYILSVCSIFIIFYVVIPEPLIRYAELAAMSLIKG
ncbi:MAG: NADH-quinone oxidoreductase subunit NuoN [Pseudomonadota bacterium]|nr:NADH-quinone oxidoreductase subunit NuoN [Pseudomonadota bacterium]